MEVVSNISFDSGMDQWWSTTDWTSLIRVKFVYFFGSIWSIFHIFLKYFLFCKRRGGVHAIWSYRTTGVKLFHDSFYQKLVETQTCLNFMECHGPVFDSKLSFFIWLEVEWSKVMQYKGMAIHQNPTKR